METIIKLLTAAAGLPLALGATALAASGLLKPVRPRGLVFHVVGSGRGWGVSYVTEERFLSLIHHLKDQGWSSQTVSRSNGKSREVVLTFDDGFLCCYDTAAPSSNP